MQVKFPGISAPTVEPEGAEHKFQRSVELHNLKYTEFYGDGDSKSFSMIKKVYQDAGISALLEFQRKRKNASVTYRRGLELHFIN